MNEYFPEVAWRTIVDNVTVAPTPHYYTVDVFPLDSNEPGADPLDIAIGYWLIDNGGYTYLITDVSGSTITVYDINERSWGDSYIGPLEDLPGYVYKTKNGAFLLSQSQLRFLDRSAPDILYPIEKGIIWKYRGIEIDALYGDSEVIETIAQESVNNITKLSLSSEFILRTEEDGWQGGKKYSLSLEGLLHNTLPDVQGTGLDDNYIHLDQDQVDALWTKVGNNIRRDSWVGIGKAPNFPFDVEGTGQFGEIGACVQIGFRDGMGVEGYWGGSGLYGVGGHYAIAVKYFEYFGYGQLAGIINSGLYIRDGNVGVKTHDPQDSFHTVGYARISTLAETGNSSIVTSNADGRLIKLPYDNDEGKYLRSDGTWAPILTSVGDFLDSVIRMVVDSTFNPGTPTNGDRYIILNASSIHANFGTINKFSNGSALTLGNNDIVQYFSANSEFRIVYDSSAAMQPATVTVGTDKNGNTNHQWTYNVTDDKWVDRGAIASHNSLGGLNDGNYKHLTAAQYTNFISLTDGSDVSNTLHNHNTLYAIKQSSTTDTTSGRGMIVGAFGLGGWPIELTGSEWDVTSRPSQFVRATDSFDSIFNRAGVGLNLKYSSSYAAQLFMAVTGTLSIKARATSGSGVWGDVEELYHTGNLVNPVTGTGIAGYLPKFTGTSALGNSVIYETGSNIAIGKTTVTSGYKLDVNGAIQSTGLKIGTLSGLLKASSGVVGAAVSGTDIKTVATNSILGSGSLINITISAAEPSTSGKLNGDIWVES